MKKRVIKLKNGGREIISLHIRYNNINSCVSVILPEYNVIVNGLSFLDNSTPIPIKIAHDHFENFVKYGLDDSMVSDDIKILGKEYLKFLKKMYNKSINCPTIENQNEKDDEDKKLKSFAESLKKHSKNYKDLYLYNSLLLENLSDDTRKKLLNSLYGIYSYKNMSDINLTDEQFKKIHDIISELEKNNIKDNINDKNNDDSDSSELKPSYDDVIQLMKSNVINNHYKERIQKSNLNLWKEHDYLPSDKYDEIYRNFWKKRKNNKRTSKFKLTGEYKSINGKIVHQIVATTDFVTKSSIQITTGTLGGWVENISNLSQDGNCWIDEDTILLGNVYVRGETYITNSIITSKSELVINSDKFGFIRSSELFVNGGEIKNPYILDVYIRYHDKISLDRVGINPSSRVQKIK